MKYGIPYKLKTDKRTVFEYKKKGSPLLEEDTFTQFAYACKQLGIQLETSSVPEFKPRIERAFQTLQQRLPQELRLAGITTIEEAIQFLSQYIKKFNKQFALDEIPEKQALSENFDEIPETKSKRIYIPPMSHPWKQSLFDNFIQLQEHRLEKVS